MGELLLNVNIVLDNKSITVPYNSSTTAEDVCIYICKQLNIGTITRHLFALRIPGKNEFLMPAALIGEKSTSLDFRIRFKVAIIVNLKKRDINAYNYYFHQARNDVLENKIPDLVYEKYRRELVGLGITDMYRVMLEKDITRETVENDYKKYIPKEVLKRHSFFIKKPIHDTLGKLQRSVREASYVKAEYIRQLEIIAPEYLSETFRAVIDQDGSICNIIIKVSPYHSTEPGVRYCMESKKEQWILICSIEDLGFISIRNDYTTEISRKNGIPFYLKFNSISIMLSFISLLDGYYRLTCKWTFNICKDVYTPSLQKLYLMKCHGPVGGEFSYAKLEAKRGFRPGCFIIRESESKYSDFYLDVCMKEGLKPKTFKLEKINSDEFIFNDDLTRYKTIQQLMNAYQDPNGSIYLHECLPPSEYDISPLLLCRKESLVGDSLTDTSSLDVLLPQGSPLCISCKNLQLLLELIYPLATLQEVPPGNLTDVTECKVSHLGLEYTGHIAKSESEVRCQSWTSNQPHKVRGDLVESHFTDGSKKLAKNYCRNPTKDTIGPWCYTMNFDLEFETCGIPLCQYSQCKITGPGMEYAGQHKISVSDRKCLKWNKNRKRVKENGNYTNISKFSNNRFPENNVADAKKFCRNPDGNQGGPWCFTENEDTNDIEKEYCDIPFCDDPECLVFTKNSNTYMHYTDFNSSLTNITFGVKLWDSDKYLEGSARLVLSLMALPLTGSEIEDAGIGIEIVISNNLSALRYGNKDKPDYEPTHGILKSTEFTEFTLSWHAGFITFGLVGKVKPIFLAEYKTKKRLLGYKLNVFNYYSAQGSNILWYFPFCKDDFECDLQTTTGSEFQQFWPLRKKGSNHDLYTHVRAHHSAGILFVSSPTVEFPQVKFILSGINNYTTVTTIEYSGASEVTLKKFQLGSVLNYWEWHEFSIAFFGNNMNIYVKKPMGLQMMAELQDEIFRNMRWFSVNSENTVAHWTFFCAPSRHMNPVPALLPECALNSQEQDYKGTQDITSDGLPCLPWSGHKLIGKEVTFLNTSILAAWNYCRDPAETNEGTYCYTMSFSPEKNIEKKFCRLRKCRSEQCRMAGTGNDFIGSLATTRSNRTCDTWTPNSFPNKHHKSFWNDTLFPDMAAIKANNFCRNPSRNISGSWCYTTDVDIPEDACNVRDCDKIEECIIVVTAVLIDRKIFIRPQWKEAGLKGGLRFAIKEWNPDLLDGISIMISSESGTDRIMLQIGAEYNEKVRLYYNNEMIQEKTLPHLIAAGKWTDLWLQIRRGEIKLGFEGVPTSLFEWESKNMDAEFEPMFLDYGSIYGKPMGLFFQNDACLTENITVYNFDRHYPIGLWLEESPIHRNFTLNLRGVGITGIRLMWLPESPDFYLLTLDNDNGNIEFSIVKEDGMMYYLKQIKVDKILAPDSWTKYNIYFNQWNFRVKKNNQTVLSFKSEKSLAMYWFSVGSQVGWVTWSANCEPLDLDGPPRDGGWSAWSSWTCTVSCGGGEGYRTRTCSNPHPNIFGKLCQGSPTASGKCNDFSCGDVSPATLEKIREHLRKENFNFVIEEGQKKEGLKGITAVFRSMWRVTQGKKIEVAMKMLKQEYSDKYLKDFMNLAGQWAFLHSSAIVRLYGIAFTSNISFVMEYFRLGPLDQYLRKNQGILKPVDLIEASSNLASALWHLTENNLVHGKIRCRKLMVNVHDENAFTVKLTDPGIHTEYASSEVHWIPVECYSNLDYAKRSVEADVWSFATTLWEIFMYGEEIKHTDHVQARRWYLSGKRLPQPNSCDKEIYGLMKECWDMDPHKRKKPQAIMRDINQLLYQVYNSRRTHSYAKVFNKSSALQNVAGSSLNSLCSNITETTAALDDLVGASELSDKSSLSDVGSQDWLIEAQDLVNLEDSNCYDWSHIFSSFNISTATTSLDSLNSMQSVFELDGNFNVVLQGRIGQGFYGEVYKATLECVDGQEQEPRQVAVKKLKSSALSSCLQDFEREINIMKSLKHSNIVEILGVLREPEISLVMEFVHHGSLQSYLKIYRESLQEVQLLKYALDIAKGMDYLGKKNIVHRDLAARNILVVDENHVKISDFGLAQVMGTNDYYILKTPNRELPIKWYAPESLRDGKFSTRSDVWSYGVTMCEMFNYGEEPNLTIPHEEMEGQPPTQVFLMMLERGARFPCPPDCPKVVYIRMIYPCWQANPHERPLFSKLILEIDDLLAQY